MFLNYFNAEQRMIESAIIQLIGSHITILKILNECLDGAFSDSKEWLTVRDEFYTNIKPWVDKK